MALYTDACIESQFTGVCSLKGWVSLKIFFKFVAWPPFHLDVV